MAGISRFTIAVLLAVTAPIVRPAAAQSSVDCRWAASQIGMAICTNRTLVELDRRLEAKYAVLEKALWYERRVAIMRDRIEWMGSGPKICEQPPNSQYDPETHLQLTFCLIDVYRKKIAELELKYPFVAAWNRYPFGELRP